MTLGITGAAENAARAFERSDYAVGVLLCVHMLCTKGEPSQRGVNLGSVAIRTARAWMAASIAWGHPPAWHLQPNEASANPLWVPSEDKLPQYRGKEGSSICLCLLCCSELFANGSNSSSAEFQVP